jgi:peptidyl-prolyl cis-trans isomerase D
MLQNIRERAQGVVAAAIILLLCLTFLLWGIESYINEANVVSVATVNGDEIQLSQFEKTFQRMRQRAQVEQGAGFNAELWATEDTKRKVLDALVEERLGEQLMDSERMRITDAQIVSFIEHTEAFQEDGKFSATQFKQVAQSLGYTDGGLESQVRKDLLLQQLRAGVALSAFASQDEAIALAQLLDQKRDVGFALIVPAAPTTITPTEAEVSAYFSAHLEDFRVPEKVSLEYLELKLDDLKSAVVVQEAALEAFYEAHKQQYTTVEERNAAQVLVQVKKDAPPAEVAAAKVKAEALRALIVAGQPIAQIAKASSDDLGSRADGGATGFFARGVMSPEFDDAAFALKVGEISPPIKTDFGYHIIQLTAVRPGGAKPFALARADVELAYRTEQAETAFFERAEQFADTVNEHPDSLAAAGEKVQLQPKTATLITREEINERFASAVSAAAWEPEVLNEGLASAPIELGPNRIVAVRVTAHEVTKIPELSTVKDDVIERIRVARVRKAVTERGEALLARLKKGEPVGALMTAEKLEWTQTKGAIRTAPDLNREVARAAFREPLAGPDAVAYLGVTLSTGAYAVVEVNHLLLANAASLDLKKIEAIQRDAERSRSIAAWRGFLDELRRSGKITTSPKNL